MYTLLFHIPITFETTSSIHFRITIHFWILFQLKLNTMAVESFKSDSQLFSTEDPMAMQRLKNATVAPIGTVDNTTVSSLRTYSQCFAVFCSIKE